MLSMDNKMNANHGGTVSTPHSPSQNVECGELGAGRESCSDNTVHAQNNIKHVGVMARPYPIHSVL